MVQPLAPVAAKPRPLPLTTEFKKSFWGGAFALQIKNQGFDPLNLDIKITGSDKTPSRSATLESGATLKVEEVAAGAQVVIASNGFESVNVTAQ